MTDAEVEMTPEMTALMSGECYCLAVRRASRRLMRLYDSVLAEHGLTIAQFALMPWIQAMKRPTVQRLADKTEMDQSTLSRSLALLEREGLVGSETDPDDRRKRILRLTDEGKRRMEAASKAWKSAQDMIAEQMGQGEIGALMQGVDKLGR